MKFNLLADSGATKTSWSLCLDGQIIQQFDSKGISPIYQTQEEIEEYIYETVFPEFKDKTIDAVYFYGSGCIPEKVPMVKSAIYKTFPLETIHVYSDLIAAVHALCGYQSGIACILGTGSNSCEWDGEKIVKQISPLGFILGDEGSGADLGKRLVNNALKEMLPKDLKETFLETYQLTPSIIIDKVYRQPFPSRFLASLSPFLLKNIENPVVRNIVLTSFSDFFEKNVMHYNYQNNKVNFVGSIAYYYADILKQAAVAKGIDIGIIYKSPMDGLIEFYKDK
ncbi:MAG: ATPase [Fermentimonas sp.]|nr:ATPase [Fermentimonas sp.]